MGYMNAADMADHANLTQALTWHLQSNHFPPVPLAMVPVCEAAIDAVLSGEPDIFIDLPEETTWRGESEAPAWAIVEGHHLEAFIESALDHPDIDNYLLTNGYSSVEDWAEDSDYRQLPDGSWIDDNGTEVNLVEQLTIAIYAERDD